MTEERKAQIESDCYGKNPQKQRYRLRTGHDLKGLFRIGSLKVTFHYLKFKLFQSYRHVDAIKYSI